ncbi:MAG: hypothetical protein ABIT47_03925 [Candidatus Paceibacterota bacterium]
MNFQIQNINTAIINALAELLDGRAQRSAKSLEGVIGMFFFEAGGGFSNREPGNPPEGYCRPYQADLAALTTMCEAIDAGIPNGGTCRQGQVRLIGKIVELSETHMARFREQRDAGTYPSNVGYIRELSPDNDWRRWMIALRQVFLPKKKVDSSENPLDSTNEVIDEHRAMPLDR